MLHLMVAAAFENIDEADQIAIHVSVWILDRIANAGLRGEVDDLVEFLFGEQFFHPGAVSHIEFYKAEAGQDGQALEPVFLERHFVVIVEIVEANDLIAARQQAQRSGHADKAGGAGNEDFHEFTLI